MKLTPKTKTTRRCSGQQKETLKFDLTINSWFTGDLHWMHFWLWTKSKEKRAIFVSLHLLNSLSFKVFVYSAQYAVAKD